MMTLCVLSVIRLGSFYPFGCINGKITSYYTTGKIIFVIWIWALIISVPPLFSWGNYVPEISGLG